MAGSERVTVEALDAQCGHCKMRGVGTYRTEAVCRNCGWRGEAVHSLTHEKGSLSGTRCPRCQCRAVAMGDFIEARESLSAGGEDT